MKYTVLDLIRTLEALEDTAEIRVWHAKQDCETSDVEVHYDPKTNTVLICEGY